MASNIPRVRSDVSANAIFTPREFKQFRRWQNLHTTLRPNEQGFLPTADEHEDFQQWLRKQDSGYFSDVFEDVAEHVKTPTADEPPTAISCRHTMHPITAGHLVKRCPVCTIDMYISYLRALEKALQGAGGRAPRAANQATTEKQEALYAAFITSKLEVLHCLEEFELQAEEEEQWQAQHKDWKNDEVRTASQALGLYWSEAFAITEAQSQKPRKTKSVKFTPGTEFCVSRPEEYFKRRSPRYTPGKYTVQTQDDECEEDEQESEEIVSEDSEDYARAPILLEQGPLIVGQSIAVYDFAQTIGVFTDTIRSYEAGIRKAEATPIGSFEIPRLEMLDDDEEDDDEEDDESDWDMHDDETDGSDYIYFEAEEDCSFVVFGED
ncbi:hypothetical protein N0V86_002353 [Didymella sp. IMI 355093]|nr:hypothetical protein N0V86_002353 [Didymella sp. IMI 355093]